MPLYSWKIWLNQVDEYYYLICKLIVSNFLNQGNYLGATVNLKMYMMREINVSAYGLKSLVAPTSLTKHSSMDPVDKSVWDAAYDEEYDGLVSLPTWTVISEKEYKQLS